jgi:AP-1 complex subunit gamma-1
VTKHASATPQVFDLLDGLSPSTPLPGLLLSLDYLVAFLIMRKLIIILLACSPDENTVYPPITAFQSATLKITFNFKKQSGKPQETTMHVSFTNLTSATLTDFMFQAAVPKVVSLKFELVFL